MYEQLKEIIEKKAENARMDYINNQSYYNFKNPDGARIRLLGQIDAYEDILATLQMLENKIDANKNYEILSMLKKHIVLYENPPTTKNYQFVFVGDYLTKEEYDLLKELWEDNK